MNNSPVEYICRHIEKRPKLWLILSIVFVFITTPGLYFFNSQNDVRIWFPKDDINILALNSFEHRFGNDENMVVAIHHPSELFTPERMEIIQKLSDELWHVPQIIRIDTLTSATITESYEEEILIDSLLDPSREWTQEYLLERKQLALEHPILPGYLISKDGKTAMIFARLTPTLVGSPNYQLIIETTREIIAKYQAEAELEIYLSGEATVNNAFREISQSDSQLILPLLIIVIIGALSVLLRSVYGVVLPLIVTIPSVTSTLGLGFILGLKFNSILNILPAILIAIAIADSVHILVSYFQYRAMGHDYKIAAGKSLRKNFIPTLLTTVTTMAGFYSLAFADLLPIQRLGIMAGTGCMIAWLLSIFFLCSFLYLKPIPVPKHFKKNYEDREHTTPGILATYFVEWIFRHDKSILISFSVVTLISLVISFQNEINSDPYKYFADGTAIKEANTFIKDNFGGVSGPEIMISTGIEDGIKDPQFLKKVEAFKDWLQQHPFVDQTIDIVDIVKEMHQSLNAGNSDFFTIPETQNQVAELLFLYTLSLPQGMDLNNRMSLDYESMRMTILWTIQTSKDWGYWIKQIENKGQELGLDLVVTGKTNLFQRMMGYVVTTFSKSVIAASFLVCILMIALFRSIKIGFISILPNILPLVFGGAFMKLSGMSLDIGTTLVTGVCLGIATDDTIHFLTNYYRMKKEGMAEKENHIYIMTYTGPALVITTVILVVAFGLFILGEFIPNVNFGVMCAFILSTALIVDLVFMPALLIMLDKKKLG